MKYGVAFAGILGLSATATTFHTVAELHAEEANISDQLAVTAVEQKDGTVQIVIMPSAKGVYVNTEYKAKFVVESKDGSKLEKTEFTADDAKVEKAEGEGKAHKIALTVKAPKGLKGKVKAVGCTKDACGRPREIRFESKR